MRISREDLLMGMAKLMSLRSTCLRKQVGAVISKNGRVISTGYAGAPSGAPHCLDVGCDTSRGSGCCRTAHAEINAIAYAARYGIPTENSHIYCTLSPCENCAKAIINAGIIAVYYAEPYRDQSGVKLLLESRVTCIHHPVPFATDILVPHKSAPPVKPSDQGELF